MRRRICRRLTRSGGRTMASENPGLFRPFLQEFFVKASDPLFTCKLKLDVLTQLATKDNCATILGELQTYVLHRDKSFVCAAVRAVGRVADARPEVVEQCIQVSEVVPGRIIVVKSMASRANGGDSARNVHCVGPQSGYRSNPARQRWKTYRWG